jgi:hypothetical protein
MSLQSLVRGLFGPSQGVSPNVAQNSAEAILHDYLGLQYLIRYYRRSGGLAVACEQIRTDQQKLKALEAENLALRGTNLALHQELQAFKKGRH